MPKAGRHSPGVHIGYLVASDRYVAAVSNRHPAFLSMAMPAIAEIATRWVSNGTATGRGGATCPA
ncbi:hypothetical protein CN079_31370 [Sinorhizobium medicae]|nr:hypothetical protein CN078_30440 [Sinorhizobium medicae]RVP68216.1 hypothetical protein CN079_31370 [Sinorhizobium medicae]